MTRKIEEYVMETENTNFSHFGKRYDLKSGDRIKVILRSNHLYINGVPMCAGDDCTRVAKWSVGCQSIQLCSSCSNSDKYYKFKICVSIDELRSIKDQRMKIQKIRAQEMKKVRRGLRVSRMKVFT